MKSRRKKGLFKGPFRLFKVETSFGCSPQQMELNMTFSNSVILSALLIEKARRAAIVSGLMVKLPWLSCGTIVLLSSAIISYRLQHHGAPPKRIICHPAVVDMLMVELDKNGAQLRYINEAIHFLGVEIVEHPRYFYPVLVGADDAEEVL